MCVTHFVQLAHRVSRELDGIRLMPSPIEDKTRDPTTKVSQPSLKVSGGSIHLTPPAFSTKPEFHPEMSIVHDLAKTPLGHE